jgi:C_GCAxxG_C_C family probable redox protein
MAPGFLISEIQLILKQKLKMKADFVDEQFSQFNCAQTVFSLFAPELGVDEKTALKIASGFGGGMACAETCGAVTGSYMVIGLKHGHDVSDPQKKAFTKMQVQKFNEKFKKRFGSLICKELAGFDISTPVGSAAARDANVFETRCPVFIKTACNILEEEF